jgi:uncharacterized membrane protein
MGKRDWRYLGFLLLAHHTPAKIHRTIHINFLGKNFYLCARCTGRYAALVGIFAAYLLGFTLGIWLYLPFIALLPLPGIADWLSQSCKLRESQNPVRLATGALLGVAEGLLLLLLLNGYFVSFLVGAGVIGGYAFGIYLLAAKTRYLKPYLDEVARGT